MAFRRKRFRTAKRSFKRRRFGGGSRRRSFSRRRSYKRGRMSYPRRIGGYGHELKYFERTLSGADTEAVVTTPKILLLNAMVQGYSALTRNGNMVYNKSLQISGHIDFATPLATAEVKAQEARVMIVVDKHANAVELTNINVILESVTVNSFLSIPNSGRFTILYDRIFTCGSRDVSANATHTAALHYPKRWSVYRKLGFNTRYTAGAGGGTFADVRENAIYLITLGTIATGNNVLACPCTTRLRFTG